ncbi:MAG: DUF2791 family P-loop domain-containing protein [Thermoleophilia bacterium]|nr:DUF2791 family P-loop domain-containing protein [Thermoleophilia bacterium]
MIDQITALHARRAIEALRAGVPNRDAVRALGFADDPLVEELDRRLDTLAAGAPDGGGLLLAAEFGGGKSHALEYLRHRALERNIAVSKVVVSKETQLFDPLKLFRSAVDNLAVDDRTGAVFDDIATTRLNSDPHRDRFAELGAWLQTSGLNACFAASMWLFEHARANAELQSRLVAFWGGGALKLTELKKDLRLCGRAGYYPLEKIRARDLARERFVFLARLLQAAGYDGWLLLLDELELVGRYSVLQRARSYGELARLLGLDDQGPIPGLFTVGAITPDFESAVLLGKDDYNQIGFRMRARGDAESELTAVLAERVMERMRGGFLSIRRPEQGTLEATFARLAAVYQAAYDVPPERPPVIFDGTWQMREYVRSWITRWDLRRFAPDHEAHPVVFPMPVDYTENVVLERPPENGED